MSNDAESSFILHPWLICRARQSLPLAAAMARPWPRRTCSRSKGTPCPSGAAKANSSNPAHSALVATTDGYIVQKMPIGYPSRWILTMPMLWKSKLDSNSAYLTTWVNQCRDVQPGNLHFEFLLLQKTILGFLQLRCENSPGRIVLYKSWLP